MEIASLIISSLCLILLIVLIIKQRSNSSLSSKDINDIKKIILESSKQID